MRRFALQTARARRLAVGLLALGLLLLAELALAWGLQGLTPAGYVASRDPVSGTVYALLLVVFALMPLWSGPPRAV